MTRTTRPRNVKRAEGYLWSSAAAHCGLRHDPVLSSQFPPNGVVADWAARLAAGEDETPVTTLRNHTGIEGGEMRKANRVYADTSVFGGALEHEFSDLYASGDVL